MIIEETEIAYEIRLSSAIDGFVSIRQEGDVIEACRDQIPALIAALQKFYDGEVI